MNQRVVLKWRRHNSCNLCFLFITIFVSKTLTCRWQETASILFCLMNILQQKKSKIVYKMDMLCRYVCCVDCRSLWSEVKKNQHDPALGLPMLEAELTACKNVRSVKQYLLDMQSTHCGSFINVWDWGNKMNHSLSPYIVYFPVMRAVQTGPDFRSSLQEFIKKCSWWIQYKMGKSDESIFRHVFFSFRHDKTTLSVISSILF